MDILSYRASFQAMMAATSSREIPVPPGCHTNPLGYLFLVVTGLKTNGGRQAAFYINISRGREGSHQAGPADVPNLLLGKVIWSVV